MMRSYAIVLIFLEGRVLMAFPHSRAMAWTSVVLVNWGCLAVTLVVMECVLRWREIVPFAQPNTALHPSAASAAISGRG